MRQLVQELGTGLTTLAEVPAPAVPRGGLCIETRRSLISAGTERMLVEFSRGGLIEKARQQPQRVRQVLSKVRTDGPVAVLEAVRAQLERPLPLGYCNAGVVLAAGEEVVGFERGTRVVSNGPHAEIVAVPRNLCARIPDEVSDDAAAFTVVAAIGLQGIRLAAPTIGETVVVTGLGLIGLLTVQMLRANGCRVLGIDFDPAKCALARRFGAATVDLSRGEEPLLIADAFTHGRGVDAVLITAATDSNEPVSQGALMCRKRGRIVLVGVAGLELNRAEFYEKELSFQVSCSYGPGRYDAGYEQGGTDYPYGFVRWTEQRNFEAVLDMMAAGTLDVMPLLTHRFAFADARHAYELLATGSEPYLGIMLEYPERADESNLNRTITISASTSSAARTALPEVGLAVIGAGNYASRVLVPALAQTGARLQTVASSGGLSGALVARKYGFAEATTDTAALFADTRVDAVAIATRHNSHASLICRALQAGKHVFVEKPLAITDEQIDTIEATWRGLPDTRRPLLMVGFNRRFAPHVLQMKRLLEPLQAPKTFIVTVNAGALPANHWTQQPAVGGGRLIGEGCHFIDLLRFLAGAPIIDWQVSAVGPQDAPVPGEQATITLTFADGSVGTVHYFANGHASFPKERVEVFVAGRILQLDNFRKLAGHGWQGFSKTSSFRQDKGQRDCAAAFVDALRTGKPAPIPLDELLEVARVTVAVGRAARGQSVPEPAE